MVGHETSGWRRGVEGLGMEAGGGRGGNEQPDGRGPLVLGLPAPAGFIG